MTIYSAALILILVMDPLGNIPVFLSVLNSVDAAKRQAVIIRECLIAFLVMVVFLFAGQYILKGLGVTTSALEIGGGIILFLIAIRMIFPPPKEAEANAEEPFIVPLAIPLTAGPSTLATILIFTTQEPHKLTQWFVAIVIAAGIFTLIMLSAQTLSRLLGKKVLIATERLMGMLLTTIAVQMFLSGIKVYFAL